MWVTAGPVTLRFYSHWFLLLCSHTYSTAIFIAGRGNTSVTLLYTMFHYVLQKEYVDYAVKYFFEKDHKIVLC